MFSTLVAGHICLDLVPAFRDAPMISAGDLIEIGPLEVRAGGCVANTGGDLHDLGVPVRIAADVGDDVLGATMLEILRGRGLDTSELRHTGHPTSYSIVVQSAGQDRMFWHHVGANEHFDGRSVDLADADLLHVGYPSILPALISDGGRPLGELLGRARASGITTSVDLAVVDHRMLAATEIPGSHARWRALLHVLLPMVDVISPSAEDVESATGITVERTPDGVLAVADRLVDQGAAIAMVSAGTAGMALATGTRDRFLAGGRVLAALGEEWTKARLWYAVEPVTDPVTTNGAGDAATAGLLLGLARSTGPAEAVALAAEAARLRVTQRELSPLAGQA